MIVILKICAERKYVIYFSWILCASNNNPSKEKVFLVKLHSNGKGNASFQVFGTVVN